MSDIKKYLFKEGLPLEFEILDLNQLLKSDKGGMMTIPHRAQFFHILWIEKGQGKHIVDFNPIEIEDHSIYFIPKDSVNIYDKLGSYHGKSIIFTDSFFCKNEQDVEFLHSSLLFNDLYATAQLKFNPQTSNLRVFLNAMETEFQREHDTTQYQMLHNMLHIFMLQAERELRMQGFKEFKSCPNLELLIQFKNLLEKKFKEEKSVKAYAADLSISEKQLNKVTASLLDKTPKQFIDERVLLEAKRLLAHSHQSVKEIAYELGYEEPTNFIKYFRKHTNATPSEFREQF